MKKTILSLVLPAHNEAGKLEPAVLAAEKALSSVPHEILIAEDGSTDSTAAEAKRLEKKYKAVRALCHKEKLGRGRALCQSFNKAHGQLVGYMDVDLATDLSALPRVLEALKTADVVTGSRYLPQSQARRTLKRHTLSHGYNHLVRIVLGSRLHDHQCGFKFFRKPVALALCRQAQARHWFWDTEVLVLAQRQGFSVTEIPVHWVEKVAGSKVNAILDSTRMAQQVFQLWQRLNKNHNLETKTAATKANNGKNKT